jgi:hypothetical protein
MKKKTLLVLLVFVLICAACGKKEPIPQPKLEPAIEPNAWMVFDKYPSKMDTERTAIFGLRKDILTESLRVFNCVDRKRNKWEEETLPIGTGILVNEDGIPVYKLGCWNKLFVPVTLKPVIATPTHQNELWSALWNLLKNLFLVLIFVLGVLLALALLALALWALWNLVKWLSEQADNRLNRNVTTRSTTTPPAPPVAPITAPPATPLPTTPIPVPTPGTAIWTIKASLDASGKISVEGEGLESISIEFPGKEISIKASRR